MRALLSRSFCPCGSRVVSLGYLSAGCRYTATQGSCTSWLRIIVLPRKPDTMPPYHAVVRGCCHDSRPILLSAGSLGTPVAVCHTALCLAQPMRGGTGNASQAHQAAASTLQGAPAVCRPHPPAPLCPV